MALSVYIDELAKEMGYLLRVAAQADIMPPLESILR
jgi:hypothetical protein